MFTSASAPSNSSYARLVDQVAAGDQVAFAALYDLLAPYLWACARAATKDERKAWQLATDVFEELWVRSPRLATGPGCPLARILKAAHDALRAAASPGANELPLGVVSAHEVPDTLAPTVSATDRGSSSP